MCNILVNDLFLCLIETDLQNFADGNTISVAGKSNKEPINILDKESRLAVGWFEENNMLVNPDKFQAIAV